MCCLVLQLGVAPVRERGLKLRLGWISQAKRSCRSRKGAWIEISLPPITLMVAVSRSRKGAWIEIVPHVRQRVPLGGRSRKGAWIEMPKRVL